MTDKRIKSFLEDRLKRLESIRNEREWTTSELGDITCCKQALAFIDSLQEVPAGLDKGKLMDMLEDSLSKETKDSWNERLDKKEPVSEDCPIWLDELDTKLKSMSKEEFQKVMRKYEEECKLQEEPVSEDFEKIVEEIAEPTILNAYGTKELARRLRNTICGTSVSEGLEEASRNYADNEEYGDDVYYAIKAAFEAGAKWQKANLWKPADGNDLPEYDKEVIVLTQPYPLGGNEYAVYFAHRPNPDGWEGKSITTGNVEHYVPKTYGKGGWNIPDVKYWLDIKFPNE